MTEELEIFTHLLEELPYLPHSTIADHVYATASFTDAHTQVAPLLVQSALVFKLQKKILPVHSKQEKSTLRRARQVISADGLCLWAYTQVLLLILQPL